MKEEEKEKIKERGGGGGTTSLVAVELKFAHLTNGTKSGWFITEPG